MGINNPQKVYMSGKATTNTLLNIRKAPDTKSPPIGRANAGLQLAFDGYTEDGENISGNSKWYFTNEGSWFWSGGVDEKLNVVKYENNVFPKWMSDLRLPEIWTKYTGRGVGVAILDTGIDDSNHDLSYNKQKTFVFDNTVALKDSDGHGTHCAGIIGARNNNRVLVGVAPECNLFVCKISESGSIEEAEVKRYADAINWCSMQDEINIISISWGSFIENPDAIAEIQNAVNTAVGKNKIIVCAIGNASRFPDNSQIYPACLNNTIACGAVPLEDKLYPYVNPFLLTSTNGFEIESYGINNSGIISRSGTSQANAIIAGIIALKVESLKLSYSFSLIKDFLTDISVKNYFNTVPLLTISGDLLLKNIFG